MVEIISPPYIPIILVFAVTKFGRGVILTGPQILERYAISSRCVKGGILEMVLDSYNSGPFKNRMSS